MYNMTTEQAQQAARNAAELATHSGYGYTQYPAGPFNPYSKAQPYALTSAVQLPLEQGGQLSLQPGSTVWLLDVTGNGFWRIYAARCAAGHIYALTFT